MTRLTVNDKTLDIDAAPDTPLLWVLRDHLAMTGTKYGCGMALCGACTVHLEGAAVRSCVLPVGGLEGRRITTIEGLSPDRSHAVQRAWIELDVRPSDAEIDAAMAGNICRCGTYARIRKAIHRAADLLAPADRSSTGLPSAGPAS
jgi:isoquinoline 1-oxidoreductase alpha subunit